MNKKIVLLCMFISSLSFSDPKEQPEVELIRAELYSHNNPNITALTHPNLYNLVAKIARRAHLDMPRYITLYSGEYIWTDENGFQHQGMYSLEPSIDLMGDLHISTKVLMTLAYDQIEGLVAIALAEKAICKNLTVALTGVGTFAASAVLINKALKEVVLEPTQVELNIFQAGPFKAKQRIRTTQDFDRYVNTAYIATIPAVCATFLCKNYLQKTVDFKAAQFTNPQNVIDGLAAVSQLTDSYVKQNILSRIGDALYINAAFRFIFYPVRAFNTKERIAYLEKKFGA